MNNIVKKVFNSEEREKRKNHREAKVCLGAFQEHALDFSNASHILLHGLEGRVPEDRIDKVQKYIGFIKQEVNSWEEYI